MREQSSLWTNYRKLSSCAVPGGYPVAKEILEGGQTFHWEETSPQAAVWIGVIDSYVIEILLKKNHLHWRTLKSYHLEYTREAVENYFAVKFPFSDWADALPWRSDEHLRNAMSALAGLRILRQPVSEALLCFLLSPLKRIPQIKEGFDTLCQRYGKPLEHQQYAAPSWQSLAQIPEQELRTCGIGYRAKGIAATARYLATHPDYLGKLKKLSTPEALTALETLPGVGNKIASCVALFSLGRIECFPIDTWIQKTLAEIYGLHNFSPEQLASFAKIHFGPQAGLAQQYLFAYAKQKDQGKLSTIQAVKRRSPKDNQR